MTANWDLHQSSEEQRTETSLLCRRHLQPQEIRDGGETDDKVRDDVHDPQREHDGLEAIAGPLIGPTDHPAELHGRALEDDEEGLAGAAQDDEPRRAEQEEAKVLHWLREDSQEGGYNGDLGEDDGRRE